MMRKNCWALLLTLMLVFFTLTVQAEPAVEPDLPRSDAALSLMEYLEADPELMALMEESIRLAHEINPDPDTNPVDTVESFYDFLDWAVIPPCSIMNPSPPGAGNTRTSGEPSSPLRRAGTIFTTSASRAIPA